MKCFYHQSKRGSTRRTFEVVPDDIWNRALEIELREWGLPDERSAGLELVASKHFGFYRVSNLCDDSA